MDQPKGLGEEPKSRRSLNTNEVAVVKQAAERLKDLRNETTPGAAEERLVAVAKLEGLRHVTIIPILLAVARNDKEASQTRVSAVEGIARTLDKDAVDALIDLISTAHAQVYSAAIEGLGNVTGVHLGNAAYSSDEEFAEKRKEMRQKWQAWWQANSAAFKPREDAVFWHRD
jgi:HEAT repeat protein